MNNECLVQILSHYGGFGGVGHSGNGRLGGYEGFKSFSNRKQCLIKGQMKVGHDLLYPPFSERKQNFLRKMLVFAMVTTQFDVVRSILIFLAIATLLYCAVFYL